jgi:hypothetical protein
MTKVFVGTLESGESEFPESRSALLAQTNVEFCHFVISGKSEKRAHAELFQSWVAHKHEYDYFLKLDADTVLMRNNAISQMCTFMQMNDATGLQIRILDYFSRELISGLNMFSPEVVFRKRLSRLYPDISDRGHRVILKGDRVAPLEPIAFHGLNPNPKQSFYYGFHRFLKGQFSLLESVYNIWKVELDLARRWALIGAIEGQRWKLSKLFYSSSFVNYRFGHIDQARISSRTIDDFFDRFLKRGVAR